MNSLQNKFNCVATCVATLDALVLLHMLPLFCFMDERVTAVDKKLETFSLPSFPPPP